MAFPLVKSGFKAGKKVLGMASKVSKTSAPKPKGFVRKTFGAIKKTPEAMRRSERFIEKYKKPLGAATATGVGYYSFTRPEGKGPII